jgi:hypothetical protein
MQTKSQIMDINVYYMQLIKKDYIVLLNYNYN